jgi:hypothetical protein
VAITKRRRDHRHELGPAPERSRNCGAARARRDREPLGEAGREVGEAERQQLLVGVDAIALARRDRPRGEHVVAVADERDAGRHREQARQVAEGDVGQSGHREPGGDRPDHEDPVFVEREDGHDHRRADHAEQHGRQRRRDALEEEHEHQRRSGQGEGPPLQVGQPGHQVADPGEERVGGDGDPREAGELAAQQREPDSGDVADEHRLGEHRREEAEPGDRTQDADAGDHEREGSHEGDVAAGVAGCDRADTGGRQDRRARLGTDAEVATGPHQRVDDSAPMTA